MAEYTIDKIEYGDNVYKLQDNVSGYVSGGNVIPYLTCGTAAGTAAKTTTLVTGTLPTTLTTGTRVAVKFTKSNTVANPTIAIGSYGAIAIKRYGTTAPSTTAATSWSEGNVITLVYDGTNWLMADWTLSSASHTHGNITSGGDITATAPTIASGDQIIINDNSASKITNGPTFDGSTTTTALTPKGTWESFAKSDTNTTYALSGALSSHKFTSTLTAGGSGSGTTSSDFTLAAGTGITITDDTSNRKMTIACSVTNTDTKVSTAAITSEVSYYPVLGSDTTEAATKFYDKTGFGYTSRIGTASTEGTAVIALGNNISTGTAGNKSGRLLLYGKNNYTASILTADLTAHTTIKFPNKSGTIALTSDITDTKVSTAAITSGTTYYPVLGSDTTSAETKFYDKTGISYVGTSGSGSTSGTATLTLGNNVAGSSGKCGYLDIYGTGQFKATLRLGSALTANRLINLPNKDGTIALTSDVVPKPPDGGNFGWVLKYSTNSASFWDPPSGFRFAIQEDSESPGTYSFNGIEPGSVQEAWTYGTSLVLELGVLNASDTYDTYTLTDYYAQEVPTEDGCYYVLWFTDVFKTADARQKQITVGIYLDDLEVEHTYGEITVTIDTVVSAGTDGSEGMTIGGWKICWGSISLTTASASGNGTYASPYYVSSSTISLNYTAYPYIWCQVQGDWTGTRYATPYDISETGFKIRLYASAKNSTSTSIRWFSIGKA